MKKLALSLVAVAVFSGTARAGGDIVPVAPAATDSWSGFYVGVQAGGIRGNADVDNYSNLTDGVVTYTHGLNPVGFVGGVYGGYNWLMENNWLIGLEGEWSYLSADDEGDLLPGHPNGGNNVTVVVTVEPGTKTKVKQKWDASLRLRMGKVFGDYLPYVTGGVAWTKSNVKIYNRDSIDTDLRLTGWTLGTGVEMKISEKLSARIQYRYTDYGDEKNTIYEDNQQGCVCDTKLDYNAHMVTVGLSYRF